MIRLIPQNVLFFRTVFNDTPDIRFPCQFIDRQGAKIRQHILGMIIERGEKAAREDQEASTESPIDSVDIAGGHMRPASWNRDLVKGAGMEGAETLQTPLFVCGNLEKAHVQPNECGIVRESSTFLHEFDLGIHEGKEFLRVLCGMTMSGQVALIGHSDPIQLTFRKG